MAAIWKGDNQSWNISDVVGVYGVTFIGNVLTGLPQPVTIQHENHVLDTVNIIANLDRDRYLRVQLMNELSLNLPTNCWLTAVTEQGGTHVTFEGITFSNYIIADLMNNLDKSKRFGDTALKVAEEGEMDDHRVIQFTLNAQLLQ